MGTMYILFLLAIACFMMAIISWHNLLDKARVDVIKGFLFLGWVAVVILEVCKLASLLIMCGLV